MTSVSASGAGNASLIQQMLQQRFQQADTDSNGGLSLAEFQAAAPQGAGDASASSKAPDPSKIFEKMDSNGDGSVSQDEFKTAFEQFKTESKAALLSAQEQSGMASLDELFENADTDDDGSISEDEFKAAAPKGPPPGPPPGANAESQETSDLSSLFEAMDVNADGFVTEDELMAALEKQSESSGEASEEDQKDTALLNALKKASDLYQSLLQQKEEASQEVSTDAVFA